MNLIDSTLLNSWKRSERYAASIDKAKDAILESHELKIKKEKHAQFVKRLHPTVEQLGSSLKSSHSVVVISDMTGVLLNTVGDPSYLKDTEKIYLQPGSHWSEKIHGTNSAGTVVKEKRPIAVVGSDHYLSSHHQIFCVGSPIFDPLGQLQGVLNISGHEKGYNPSYLHFIDTVAREVENKMLLDTAQSEVVISLKNTSESPFEALIAVDQDAKITGVNRAAREMLPLDQYESVSIQLGELFIDANPLLDQAYATQLTFHIVHIQKNNDKKSFIASIVKNDFPKKHSILPIKKSTNQFLEDKGQGGFSHIIGQDKTFLRALETAKKVAKTSYPISIIGESGTGKDLVSYAIHKASERSNQPFVALNCGGITDSLAESELFGYESGSFTGAKQSGHAGVFERANGGTLFLDEIAELPLDLQVSLLRVLQDFKVTRVGGSEPVEVDVRIITATHTDLWGKVQEGSFRDDLFYRLQGVQIELPPLRDRRDRLQYAHHFLKEITEELQTEKLTLTPSAQELITNYEWPGNIRQLKSALREASFLAEEGVIHFAHFPSYITQSTNQVRIKPTDSLLQDVENKTIIQTLKKTSGNISEAARILGVGRNTLYRKIERIRKTTPIDFI